MLPQVALSIAVLALASSVVSAQQDGDLLLEFRTQLVEVPFRAADRNNHPISDLKAEEIKVYENDTPVEIVSLQRTETQPLSFALLIDRSGSMQTLYDEVSKAAVEFFDRALKSPKDTAAVIAFQREVHLIQPPTQDKSLLKQAINKKNLIINEANILNPFQNNLRFNGTALIAAIHIAVDEVLRRSKSRRVVVLLSDGYDSESGIELREVLDYAWRNEVTIYAIGIGELNSLNREVLERLCASTGGRTFYLTAGETLSSALNSIDDDLRKQYIVSFYPSEQQEGFRSIRLELPGRPQAKLRHRLGYYSFR
ncbi:MAG: VWA domain-containing protein [Acidobacteriota bacterium]|nr:VWA domain-containing protein [Blastocatellia bacterium]MDW8413328.1 VWA domain-containing protein [Acidobacteriota bacterium]